MNAGKLSQFVHFLRDSAKQTRSAQDGIVAGSSADMDGT